ncbi:signal recognition particle 9 kDa protein [Senna tora]|uniref:Signal recognition particle 9 kDa protein n=1 Tax=Senna tora TaxID=362788 RepID=A0A834WJT0_9FABA|nr:signal recognition particle 9 kDa protein [Senna tora]
MTEASTREIADLPNCFPRSICKKTTLGHALALQTRYVMKYRHCDDGKLVLKVTDNREFKTDQAQEAKKMEKLNNIFFALMARGPDVSLMQCPLVLGFTTTLGLQRKKVDGRAA